MIENFNLKLTNVLILKGQSRLERVIRMPVENEQTFAATRIVYQLDLASIYPEKLPERGFVAWVDNVAKTESSVPLLLSQPSFNLVIEGSKIYFLGSSDQPGTLRLNIFLNSTLKPTQTILKYSKVFEVKPAKGNNMFAIQLKSSSSLEQILKSEKAILENFNKLWNIPSGCEDCLWIAYIRPNEHEYETGVASTLEFSELLDEFCLFHDIPAEHLNITDFAVNRQDVQCLYAMQGSVNCIEDFTPLFRINAVIGVSSEDMNHTHFTSISSQATKPIIKLY